MVLYAENATLTPPTIGTIECVIWYGLNASLYMVRDESGATRCERTPVGAPAIHRTIGGALVIKAETNTCGVAVELAHCPPTPVTHAEHTNATLKMELVEFVDSMFAPLLTIPSDGSEVFEYVGVLIAVISTLGSIGGLICRRRYHKTYVSIHQYAPQDGHITKKPGVVMPALLPRALPPGPAKTPGSVQAFIPPPPPGPAKPQRPVQAFIQPPPPPLAPAKPQRPVQSFIHPLPPPSVARKSGLVMPVLIAPPPPAPDAVKAPELVVPILQVKTAFTRNQPKTTNLGRTYNV
jgi:hypothetical protein